MNLPETFFNPKQARDLEGQSQQQKKQGTKERGKKNIQKSKSLKPEVTFSSKNLKVMISAHAWAKMS